MAAPEFEQSWIDLQRQREQRMRYEILDLLHRLSGGAPAATFDVVELGAELGVWKTEVYRVMDWLSRQGMVQGWGSGPRVSITEKGVAYIRESPDADPILTAED